MDSVGKIRRYIKRKGFSSFILAILRDRTKPILAFKLEYILKLNLTYFKKKSKFVPKLPVKVKIIDNVHFHSTGKIRFSTFYKAQNLNILMAKLKLESAGYYESGDIASGKLLNPQMINTPIGNLEIKSFGVFKNGKGETGFSPVHFKTQLFFFENSTAFLLKFSGAFCISCNILNEP